MNERTQKAIKHHTPATIRLAKHNTKNFTHKMHRFHESWDRRHLAWRRKPPKNLAHTQVPKYVCVLLFGVLDLFSDFCFEFVCEKVVVYLLKEVNSAREIYQAVGVKVSFFSSIIEYQSTILSGDVPYQRTYQHALSTCPLVLSQSQV